MLQVEELNTLPSMIGIAIGMAIVWGAILEVGRKWIYNTYLPNTPWWKGAVRPTTSMMHNFGYPKSPTPQFPEAVTETMARDFFAFLIAICFQHFMSVLPMLPLVIQGWEGSSELVKCLFLLGTLSDVGFDIYDGIKSTIRAFSKSSDSPIPIDFWIVVVMMHHTLALALVIPMNLRYIHLEEYHQTVASLLLAASICYTLGNYKFTLNIETVSGFYQYKAIVIIQLITIAYTRVYLWFPTGYKIIRTFYDANDKPYFYLGCFMGTIFSLFNILLMVDALSACAGALPKKLPKSEKEVSTLRASISDGHGAAPASAFAIVASLTRRRKLKGAVHSVIAMNRMKKMTMATGKEGASKSD